MSDSLLERVGEALLEATGHSASMRRHKDEAARAAIRAVAERSGGVQGFVVPGHLGSRTAISFSTVRDDHHTEPATIHRRARGDE